jgi:flagellar hook-associated protein 1 FlgK
MPSTITTDLFNIATSGVNASNQLLQTTSSNIANVNTEGYVRERTSFVSQLGGGVGRGTTARVIDQFAQNQLRRDTTTVGEWEVYENKINAIDNILASEANSLASGLSNMFAAIQTAADDPSSVVSREVVLGEARQFLSQIGNISGFLEREEDELNLQFNDSIEQANSLIEAIGTLNKAIVVAEGNNPDVEPGALLNQRDLAINQLASLLSIEIRDGAGVGNTINVSLSSGESLVLDDGSFNLLALGSSADLTTQELQLTTSFENKNNTVINVREDNLGGSIGGLFRFRDEVLGVAQRDIGQLAVAFGDAINSQNRLGLDLDQQLGGDIFALPEFTGLPFDGTSGDLTVNGRFTAGEGINVTDADIKITVTSVDASVPPQPDEITIEFLEGNGDPKLDESGNPVIFTGVTVGAGFTDIEGGIDIGFDTTESYAVDNEFLLQPTKFAGSDIALATNRPEDLAFALPIRVTPDVDNFGDLKVTATRVTNTTVGTGTDRSAFDGTGDIDDVASSPSATLGAPAQIVFDSSSQFTVFDSAGNTITVVTGISDYQNLLAQAQASGAGPAWPAAFSSLEDYPGYDVSLEGEPAAGDSFTFEYNTNGLDDNRNAILLAQLQEEGLVQLSSQSDNQTRTLHEAYSSLVGAVGSESANADITLQAAEALKAESSEWLNSVSGVSLDEEAANLIRFQQSYSAAARILSTAQTLFDTLLSAVR